MGNPILPRCFQDLIPWEIVYELSAVLGNHNHVLQPYTANPRLALSALDCYNHPLFQYLGVLEGPLPIDDGHLVAGPQANTVSNLAAKHLGFLLIAPGRDWREVLGRIGRSGPGFDLINDGI